MALLFAFGGLAYILVATMSRRLSTPMQKSLASKVSEVEESVDECQKYPEVSSPDQGAQAKIGRRRRRAAQQQNSHELGSSTMHEVLEVPEVERTEAKSAPCAVLEASGGPSSVRVEKETPALSGRVAKLMAKKAERKARKAQTAQEPAVEPSQDLPFLPCSLAACPDDASPVAESTPCSAGDCSNSAGDDTADSTRLQDAEELTKDVLFSSGSDEDLEQRDDATSWDESEPQICSSDLSDHESVPSVFLETSPPSEIDTADRLVSSSIEGEVGPTWASSWTPYSSIQGCIGSWTSHARSSYASKGHWENDGWMSSFEDLIKECPAAQGVFQEPLPLQMMDTPQPRYQPVLSDSGEQLYTDGKQVFVMACIGVPNEADAMAADTMITPVVDPLDPRHQVYASMVGSIEGVAPYSNVFAPGTEHDSFDPTRMAMGW
eukprot:CAMPEP_0170589908 /NCGR_PEP_ID=MMETSP0224-20130122/11590_1 /TAXON_ID=285029 /ORGANISM="Togula jolla, Strain CCCM 725" /LENGTH=434 /DNA_ID=CAMNT_0010913675 /DNA_START=84 /DNA_END=1388 /DNA_ORIENTATION=+